MAELLQIFIWFVCSEILRMHPSEELRIFEESSLNGKRGRDMSEQELIRQALWARRHAYAPYSNFYVGAALEAEDGTIFSGCNIENAAFTPGNCAERTAIFKAVSQGVRTFRRIAIAGGHEEGNVVSGYAAPCGVCRQVMMEFCNPKTFEILVAKSEEDYRKYTLEQLLPEGFGPSNL